MDGLGVVLKEFEDCVISLQKYDLICFSIQSSVTVSVCVCYVQYYTNNPNNINSVPLSAKSLHCVLLAEGEVNFQIPLTLTCTFTLTI